MNARKPDLDRVCDCCGAPLTRRRAASGRLEDYGWYQRRRFCSPHCSWMGIPAEIRFWDKVDKSGDCWLWMASKNEFGYGQFFPTVGQRVKAHRFAYELLIGPIPDGLHLDHLCRNRACVRPEHLEPVTNEENWWRGTSLSRINAEKDQCKRGHIFNAANTRVSKEGWRYCRACDRLAAQRYRAQKKGRANAS